MNFQTGSLRAQLAELQRSIHEDAVSAALRDVKEYAARTMDLNVDSLQMKLMHLEECARLANHDERQLYSTVMQRFLCHKSHKSVGFLITSLLSSPAEARILEKEQKFLKLHSNAEKPAADPKVPSPPMPFEPFPFPPMPSMRRPRMPFQFTAPRPFGGQRRGFVRPRVPGPGYSGCYTCGDPQHFQADCPRSGQF